MIRLEQELADTRLELAEVVIDKEASEGTLKIEVDSFRADIESQILATKSHFNEMQLTVRQTLEQQVAEVRAEAAQATDKEATSLRQLLDSNALREQQARDAVVQKLEERLEADKQESMSFFHKIDKVMHDETSGVVQKLDNVNRLQRGLEESSRRTSEEVRRITEESSVYAKKFQELQELQKGAFEKLEPRVFQLEEDQRHVAERAERMQGQMKVLLASRYSSPADEAREGAMSHAGSNASRAGLASPMPTQSEDDAWRFSHSVTEPASRATGPANLGGHRKSMSGSVSAVRDGPARAAVSLV